MIHDIGIVLALVKSPIARIDSVGINVLSKTEDIANARHRIRERLRGEPEREPDEPEEGPRDPDLPGRRLSLARFMNQAGHLVRKSDMIAYGLKMKIGLAKAGDTSSMPVQEIPIEKGEPLALELAHFVESVARPGSPKVGAALGKSALEVAIAITDQIRRRENSPAARRHGPRRPSVPLRPAGGRARGPPDRRRASTQATSTRPGWSGGSARPGAELRVCALGRRPAGRGGRPAAPRPDGLVGHRLCGGDPQVSFVLPAALPARPSAGSASTAPGGLLRRLRRVQPGAGRRPPGARGSARRAEAGSGSLYYISPQIWASGPGGGSVLARSIDAMAVIFPFEPACYADTALPVDFVGHPFVASDYRPPVRYDPSGPVLLLPGSRRKPSRGSFPRSSAGTSAAGVGRPAAAIYPSEDIAAVLRGVLGSGGDGHLRFCPRGGPEPVGGLGRPDEQRHDVACIARSRGSRGPSPTGPTP